MVTLKRKKKKKLIFIKECEFCKFKLLSYILNLFAYFYLKRKTYFKRVFFLLPPSLSARDILLFFPHQCVSDSPLSKTGKLLDFSPLDCSIFWTGIVHETAFLKVKESILPVLLVVSTQLRQRATQTPSLSLEAS